MLSAPLLPDILLAENVPTLSFSTAKALLAAYVPRILGESRMRVYVNPLLRCVRQLAAEARRVQCCDCIPVKCAEKAGTAAKLPIQGTASFYGAARPIPVVGSGVYLPVFKRADVCRVDTCKMNLQISARNETNVSEWRGRLAYMYPHGPM